MSGRVLSASPEVPSSTRPWLPTGVPVAGRQASCGALTDSDGRVTLAGLPPGATRVSVRLFNSTFSRVVTVPEDGREIVLEIPDGLLPVRVTDRETSRPVASARLTWTAGGGTIEAITNPNGDALIEAVGPTGGTLSVNARDYEEVEGSFDDAPAGHQEVALKPLPARRVPVRIVGATGEPVPGAIVHFLPPTPSEPGEIAVTDKTGMVSLLDVGPGALRLSVTADGFADATVQIPEEDRSSIVVRLTRAERPLGR
jgi:hypothetical protein